MKSEKNLHNKLLNLFWFGTKTYGSLGVGCNYVSRNEEHNIGRYFTFCLKFVIMIFES
jgi:hypothetical protein